MAEEPLLLRFRNVLGDLGPFEFSQSLTIQQIKDTLFEQWPTEGPMAKEPPSCSAELRLLCSGKYLDNAKVLTEYHREMGDPEPGAVVTMHILVRPAASLKGSGKELESKKEPKSGCGCVIC